MADEVQGSVQGGNGERLELKLGTKALGIQAKDLVSILLILGGLVGGYLLYTSVIDETRLIRAGQIATRDALQQNREDMLRTLKEWEHAMDTQTQDLRRMLETLQYNLEQDPNARVPLERPPPSGPRPPSTGP